MEAVVDMQMNRLIEHLRRSPDERAGQTDGQLLDRFVRDRDGPALAALVRRHAPMVWGVCRRILTAHPDAEDAFLVLVRKADVVPRAELVGNWLYGVARQTAVRMRALAARRGERERQVAVMPEPTSADEYLWNDLGPVLDDELGRLPDKYRVLLVLCDLQGRTRKEVARQLAIPEGTVASRLATARAMLAKRLSRRGVVVSGALLVAVLASRATVDAAPPAVVSTAIRNTALAATGAGSAGAVSPTVDALIMGVTNAMCVGKIKATAAVVLVVGLALGGIAVGLGRSGDSAAMAQPNSPGMTATNPPAGAGDPVAARHRVSVVVNKAAPWPDWPRCAFLDNDRILVHVGTGTLEIRDAKTGKVVKSVGLDRQSVGDFRLSPDRKWVAAVTVADTTGTFVTPQPDVTVWDTTTWKVRGRITGCRLLDLAADGRTVLIQADDGWGGGDRAGRVELWDVVEKKKLKTAPFEFRRIDAAAFSPDGSLVAVSGLNEIAYWPWRAANSDKCDRVKAGRKVDALVFSPDGKLVAEGPDTRMTVEVRDAGTLKVAHELSDPAQPRVPFAVAGMVFADSGKTLVLGNGVGLIETVPVPHRIHFWDVRSEKITRKIDLKGGAPYSLDVSPSGDALAVVTADAGVSLRVFDLRAAGPEEKKPDQPVAADGEIVGQLIDAATGKPVEGATVACGAVINDSGKGGGANAVTDARGRYRLQVPSPEIYNVWLKQFDKDRTKTAAADDGILVEARKVSASRLLLVTGCTLTGKVVDADGKPVANIGVSCHSPARPMSGGVESTKTKADGTFEFALPPGRAYVYATEPGANKPLGGGRSAHTHVQVPATGDVAAITLTLKEVEVKFGDSEWLKQSTPGTRIVRRGDPGTVTGTVVDGDGNVVAGAKVFRYDGPIVAANDKGEFRVEAEKGTQFIMCAFAPSHHVWFGTPTSGDVLKIVLERKEQKMPRPDDKEPEKKPPPNPNPLARPVALSADKMPLRDALTKLAKDTDLGVELDAEALKQVGLDLEKPVSAKFEHMPLAKALGYLIDWNAHPEVLREVRRGKLVLTTLAAWQVRVAEKLPEWMKPLYNKGLLATLDDDDAVVTVTAGAVVTDDLLAKLKTLPKLRELHVETTKGITPVGLAHLAKMPRLEKLSAYAVNTEGPGLGDEIIRSLVGLESLRELSITECGTTAAGAKLLEKLPQLTSLTLRQEGLLTDEALKSIGKLSGLKSLSLPSCVGTERFGWMRFSADGIRHLKGLQDLESLHLVGQEVPADALAFPKLTALSLGHPAVDDAAAARVGGLRELRELELAYCALGDAGLKRIAALPELRRLSISSSTVTDAGIGHFRTHKHLEHVTLRVTGLTDDSLGHLAQIETLTGLELYGSGKPGVAPGRNFSIAGLQQLKKLPKLERLWLGNLDLPGRGYGGLKELKHLRELTLMMTNVTDAELELLAESLPGVRISAATGGGSWAGPKRKR